MNYIISRGLPSAGKSAALAFMMTLPELKNVKVASFEEIKEYMNIPEYDASRHLIKKENNGEKKNKLMYDLMFKIGTQRGTNAEDIVDALIKDHQLKPKEIMRLFDYTQKRMCKCKTFIFDDAFIQREKVKIFYEATEPNHVIFDILSNQEDVIKNAKEKYESIPKQTDQMPDEEEGEQEKEKHYLPEIENKILAYEPIADWHPDMQFPHIVIKNEGTMQDLEMKVKSAVQEAKDKGWLQF